MHNNFWTLCEFSLKVDGIAFLQRVQIFQTALFYFFHSVWTWITSLYLILLTWSMSLLYWGKQFKPIVQTFLTFLCSWELTCCWSWSCKQGFTGAQLGRNSRHLVQLNVALGFSFSFCEIANQERRGAQTEGKKGSRLGERNLKRNQNNDVFSLSEN